MTTYFTPVGALAENTRAKGSDINNREAAVTAGFVGIEAVVAVTNGVAGIVYGTTWTTVPSYTSLRKVLGGLIILNLNVSAGGSPGAAQVTLPVGYRPTVDLGGVPAVYYDASAAATFPAFATITAAGLVTIVGVNGSTQIAPALADAAYLHVIFPSA